MDPLPKEELEQMADELDAWKESFGTQKLKAQIEDLITGIRGDYKRVPSWDLHQRQVGREIALTDVLSIIDSINKVQGGR